jgi:hypothetical protein
MRGQSVPSPVLAHLQDASFCRCSAILRSGSSLLPQRAISLLWFSRQGALGMVGLLSNRRRKHHVTSNCHFSCPSHHPRRRVRFDRCLRVPRRRISRRRRSTRRRLSRRCSGARRRLSGSIRTSRRGCGPGCCCGRCSGGSPILFRQAPVWILSLSPLLLGDGNLSRLSRSRLSNFGVCTRRRIAPKSNIVRAGPRLGLAVAGQDKFRSRSNSQTPSPTVGLDWPRKLAEREPIL